jgi:hypothetical protein
MKGEELSAAGSELDGRVLWLLLVSLLVGIKSAHWRRSSDCRKCFFLILFPLRFLISLPLPSLSSSDPCRKCVYPLRQRCRRLPPVAFPSGLRFLVVVVDVKSCPIFSFARLRRLFRWGYFELLGAS